MENPNGDLLFFISLLAAFIFGICMFGISLSEEYLTTKTISHHNCSYEDIPLADSDIENINKKREGYIGFIILFSVFVIIIIFGIYKNIKRRY